MGKDKYWEVVEANIIVHSAMSDQYTTCEPHFRPENIAVVESRLAAIIKSVQGQSLIDLGCGTGFIINIAKKYVNRITGVDVTQAMLDRVDKSGSCEIHLINHDTGSVVVPPASFDVATAYSFLHHLYDIEPTLKTAFNALKKGGKLYVDLEPNFYFWQELNKLNRDGDYDSIVKREIESVCYKDEEIARNFGLEKETFNDAEFGKSTKGGFKDEELTEMLEKIGFRNLEFHYYWFLGQGVLINEEKYSREDRFQYAGVMNEILQRALPVSRPFYKYLGFVATK